MAAVRGYWRRRGWMAWHVAKLVQADPKAFPELSDLTGERDRPAAAAQTPEQMLHSLRLWRAVLSRRG